MEKTEDCRSIEFYRNIYRVLLGLEEDSEFFPGTPDASRRRGIDFAIEKMALTPQEMQAVFLRFECGISNKDIAGILSIPESRVSAFLGRFRAEIRLSPYRMYMRAGDEAGERYTLYVKGLFLKTRDEAEACFCENCEEQIGWLPAPVLGLFGVSGTLIRDFLKAGLFQINAVLREIRLKTPVWEIIQKKNKRECRYLVSLLTEYRLLR